MKLILASNSKTRIKLLKAAKIQFETESHSVDEEEVKQSMADRDTDDIIEKLAELKALKVSNKHPESFVIASDQGLDLEGTLFNKAQDKSEALEQLKVLNGKTHKLITSTIVAHNNNIVWRHYDIAELTMRNMSNEMIEKYVNELKPEILNVVGCYAIEEEGIKLFNSVRGDIFSIQGISITPLLNFLWNNRLLF
tara:strand:- start:130 stop:714 length:585 start_codon:yes stop_codon:yes gene_type:complete